MSRLAALPMLFRRACVSLRPSVRIALPADDECDVAPPPLPLEQADDDAAFRVTDRLRRWTRARYFARAEAALWHASETGGIVWQRYVGPTGAANWWSLTEEECEALAGDCAAAAAAPAATVRRAVTSTQSTA